jgi:Putative zinc-finger
VTPCTLRPHIDHHFEGTLSPRDERVMREHLPTCDACRDYYQRHLVLARLDPEALPAEERIARGLGLGRRSTLARVVSLPFAAAFIAAAAAVALYVHERPSGFEARGNLLHQEASRVFVYDVPPDATPALAVDSIGARDELAFAYENGGGKSRLMVFGVDEHNHVYWFYPAYENPAEDPVAIPIEKDSRRHELPDAVRHHFDGTQLSVRALFLDTPVPVHQVEALLGSHPTGPLPLQGVIESSTSLTIVR